MGLILDLIMLEYSKAIEKHPEWPEDLFEQGCILTEELGEAVRAINQYKREKGSLEEIKTELYQTAAMCIRILKNLENE